MKFPLVVVKCAYVPGPYFAADAAGAAGFVVSAGFDVGAAGFAVGGFCVGAAGFVCGAAGFDVVDVCAPSVVVAKNDARIAESRNLVITDSLEASSYELRAMSFELRAMSYELEL
jgi:hypothetical protein